jgi:hypothetical protein
MSNSNLVSNNGEQIIPINTREEFESDENGLITIERTLREPIFVYDKETGKKIKDWSITENGILLKDAYKQVVIDYYYDYDNGCTIM